MADSNSTIIYKDIAGHPGYRVGSDGSVWCCKGIGNRRGALSDQWRKLTLKPRDKAGRIKVSLSPVRTVFKVHILVLEAFVGPRPPGMVACHFPDRNPANNAITNLRWDTPKANCADAKIHGTIPEGERHGMAKLTTEKVRLIRTEYASGKASSYELAKKYGVSPTTIKDVIIRKTWRHVT